jgi:hypothetical protein
VWQRGRTIAHLIPPPQADPAYHNSLDTSDREGYDLEQARSYAHGTSSDLIADLMQMRLITSTVLATLLSLVPFQV